MGVFGSSATTLDDELRQDGHWQAARTPVSIGVAMLFLIPISVIWCLVLPVIGLLWMLGILV